MGVTSNFFTGRQEILQRLDSFFALRDTGGSPRREFILHGMGGVGKTEIAFKVSEALEERFVDFCIRKMSGMLSNSVVDSNTSFISTVLPQPPSFRVMPTSPSSMAWRVHLPKSYAPRPCSGWKDCQRSGS